MSLKRRHSRERPGGRLLTAHELHDCFFPPAAKFDLKVRQQARDWHAAYGAALLALPPGSSVPSAWLPPYFAEAA